MEKYISLKMSIIAGIATIYLFKKASNNFGLYSKKLLTIVNKLKKKYFPDPPPDVYIDFNIFYEEYNLPSTHTYDANLKYKVKSGMKDNLLDAVTDAINRDYHKLYEILVSSNDIQQGIKFSDLFNDFQRLPKSGNREIKMKGQHIIFARYLSREFKIATIIDPLIDSVATSKEPENTHMAFLPENVFPKEYCSDQQMSLDSPHRISQVRYQKFGDMQQTDGDIIKLKKNTPLVSFSNDGGLINATVGAGCLPRFP